MEGNHNSTPKDYYKILEVEYDATDEKIRLNYRKLALKWHPDKHKGDSSVTAKFQEINEAYNVLIDPDKRFEYDITGIYEIDKYTLREYLARFKGMILTCNGLGIPHTSIWTQQLRETNEYADDEKGPLYESKSRNFIGIDHFILIEPEFVSYLLCIIISPGRRTLGKRNFFRADTRCV
ncbi:hypothetical protein ERO13_D08G240700v2 [Gossypium hirsutum]|uniref:ER-phagy receptor 1 isoform X1 n=3 Tax=Gossypium TaxID=3633 RepID=A0A1U8JSY8_GOSHI|nr:ER-phagy receptor 1-like isoform X1 [Gossypium hirsutum]KAG4135821.1 hypothetical protein ERO13_D08G240700v2 [Gossypium hirsutum]KJB26710.1 hypothetical protein B456_004G256000 [Gossypium raimondii]TYH60186.1 hypothetical protein ES332_D08G275800v1 [Gossypium tomentosum]